ncbi:ribonuclease E inhibitor RraB [Nocardioides aquiterrae]|uniref:Regulator of ribonuclease activity B domain-containing protein n=1 Tax=Nocardioides aquiterrae TaxID=203799 RepID=A0ABP4FDG7_9ACTN
MKLFRRSRRGPVVEPLTGHPGDDLVLAHLGADSDLSQPRDWAHYLYFHAESHARAAAEVVAAAGWEVTVGPVSVAGMGWGLVAEQQGVVTSPAAVRDARTFFEAVASRHGAGLYDGWEAGL